MVEEGYAGAGIGRDCAFWQKPGQNSLPGICTGHLYGIEYVHHRGLLPMGTKWKIVISEKDCLDASPRRHAYRVRPGLVSVPDGMLPSECYDYEAPIKVIDKYLINIPAMNITEVVSPEFFSAPGKPFLLKVYILPGDSRIEENPITLVFDTYTEAIRARRALLWMAGEMSAKSYGFEYPKEVVE